MRHAAARTVPAMAAILLLAPAAAWSFAADLFGYQQAVQSDVETLPQWLSVVERHLRDDLRDGDCTEKRINRCHMARWLEFLDGVRARSPQEQLREVNRYVNSRDYVLDIENYGVEDYWAIPREHFGNGGDCEDFAIVWSIFDFAIVVSNTGQEAADVSITGPNNVNINQGVAPGTLTAIFLPWVPALKRPDADTCGAAQPVSENENPALWRRVGPLVKNLTMHKTDSINLFVCVEGLVTSINDDDDIERTPGDAFVQLGSMHAWSYRGDPPCFIGGLLIDSDPATIMQLEKLPVPKFKSRLNRFKRYVSGTVKSSEKAIGKSRVLIDDYSPN